MQFLKIKNNKKSVLKVFFCIFVFYTQMESSKKNHYYNFNHLQAQFSFYFRLLVNHRKKHYNYTQLVFGRCQDGFLNFLWLILRQNILQIWIRCKSIFNDLSESWSAMINCANVSLVKRLLLFSILFQLSSQCAKISKNFMEKSVSDLIVSQDSLRFWVSFVTLRLFTVSHDCRIIWINSPASSYWDNSRLMKYIISQVYFLSFKDERVNTFII